MILRLLLLLLILGPAISTGRTAPLRTGFWFDPREPGTAPRDADGPWFDPGYTNPAAEAVAVTPPTDPTPATPALFQVEVTDRWGRTGTGTLTEAQLLYTWVHLRSELAHREQAGGRRLYQDSDFSLFLARGADPAQWCAMVQVGPDWEYGRRYCGKPALAAFAGRLAAALARGQAARVVTYAAHPPSSQPGEPAREQLDPEADIRPWREALQRRGQLAAARACYRTHLARAPRWTGTLTFALALDDHGHLAPEAWTPVSRSAPELPERLSACLQEVLLGAPENPADCPPIPEGRTHLGLALVTATAADGPAPAR